jgi:hypothetical protein
MDAQLGDALVETFPQPGDLGAKIALDLQDLALGRALLLGSIGIERVAVAQHRLLDLFGYHGADAAEVFADLLDLPRRDVKELEIALKRPRGRLLIALADEVMDEDLRRTLSMAVDAAISVLEPVRVPGNFVATSRWQ